MKTGRFAFVCRMAAVLAAVLLTLGALSSQAVAKAKGWTYYNGAYYYVENNGSVRKNAWATYGGTYYYFGSNGRVATNSWVKYKGSYYYVGADGKPLVSSPLTLKGMRYYFNDKGVCVMSAPDGGPYVSTVFYKTIYSPDDGLCVFDIPSINITSAYANAVNKSVNAYIDEANTSIADINKYGYANFITFRYAYATSGDVLSVAFYTMWSGNSVESYYAVNISTTTGGKLSTEEVVVEAGLTMEEYRAALKANLQAKYEELYSPSLVGYETCLEESLADDNLALAVPFIYADGKLYAAVPYFSPVGANGYWTWVPIQ